MMTLAELSPVASAALPLSDLRDHLRLPQGFPDDGSFDGRLEQSLRAGLAAAEARIGKALFTRSFQWGFDGWSGRDCMAMPIAPFVSLGAVALRRADGALDMLDVDNFTVIKDRHRPAICPQAGLFPTLSLGTTVEVTFDAGFGASWVDIPADLREAVLIMAVDYYDAPEGAGVAPAAQMLLDRHKGLSLGRIGA